MTTLTVEISETLTKQLQAYGISQQQVQELVTAFMQNYLQQYQAQYANDETLLPTNESPLSPEDKAALANLDQASDDALWNIAQTAVTQVDTKTLEQLSNKQKTTKLTTTEQTQVQDLLSRYDQAVLMRAKALALLKRRGRDISPLLQLPIDS